MGQPLYTRAGLWYSTTTATKGNDMASYTDLVAEFEAAYPGQQLDAYSFAEWLCDERQYFGPLEADSSDLESAWQQAMDWYRQAREVRA